MMLTVYTTGAIVFFIIIGFLLCVGGARNTFSTWGMLVGLTLLWPLSIIYFIFGFFSSPKTDAKIGMFFHRHNAFANMSTNEESVMMECRKCGRYWSWRND